MEVDVGRRVLVDVLERRVLLAKGPKVVPQGRDLGVGGLKRDEPRGHALKRRPDLDCLDDLCLCLAGDDDPASRQYLNEAFLLKLCYRFPDGGTADAETVREFAFIEPDRFRRSVNVKINDRVF